MAKRAPLSCPLGGQRALVAIDTLTVRQGRPSPRLLGWCGNERPSIRRICAKIGAWLSSRPRCGPPRRWSRACWRTWSKPRPLGRYQVHLRFEDGVEADPDLGELISCQGPSRLFGTWHTFAELRLHPELATICWPGRADLDSDVLYASASGKL